MSLAGAQQQACEVILARDDEDFTSRMYALVPRLHSGLTVVGQGPVSPALARDAQQALRSEGVTLIWLARGDSREFTLGLPDGLSDDELEAVYAAVESALPELLDPAVRVTVAPLPQVLALSASGR